MIHCFYVNMANCVVFLYLLIFLGPRKYPADLRVKFPNTTVLVGQAIILECFALGK